MTQKNKRVKSGPEQKFVQGQTSFNQMVSQLKGGQKKGAKKSNG